MPPVSQVFKATLMISSIFPRYSLQNYLWVMFRNSGLLMWVQHIHGFNIVAKVWTFFCSKFIIFLEIKCFFYKKNDSLLSKVWFWNSLGFVYIRKFYLKKSQTSVYGHLFFTLMLVFLWVLHGLVSLRHWDSLWIVLEHSFPFFST